VFYGLVTDVLEAGRMELWL